MGLDSSFGIRMSQGQFAVFGPVDNVRFARAVHVGGDSQGRKRRWDAVALTIALATERCPDQT